MRSRHRGYMLIEAAVGGAMVAVLLASVFTALADGRRRNVIGGRDVVASQLVLTKLEELRARGFGNGIAAACGGVNASDNPIANQQGRYVRTCAFGSGSDSLPGLATPIQWEEVTITVTYETAVGPRTQTAVTRVYNTL